MGFGLLLLLGAVALLSATGVIISLIVIAIGATCLHRARRIHQYIARHKHYIALVVNHSEESLDRIALIMKVPYSTVDKDLRKMIQKGYLSNYYINILDRTITLVAPIKQMPAKTAKVTCNSCGAHNRVEVGKPNECAYCEMPLFIDENQKSIVSLSFVSIL